MDREVGRYLCVYMVSWFCFLCSYEWNWFKVYTLSIQLHSAIEPLYIIYSSLVNVIITVL